MNFGLGTRGQSGVRRHAQRVALVAEATLAAARAGDHPATLWPGTGWPSKTGAPGTADAGWLRAFDAVVPDVLPAFAPEILVSQHGCDTHRLNLR